MTQPNASEPLPPIFADDEEAYNLLLRAVNLGALVHNMLMRVPEAVEDGRWAEFLRKAHAVRLELNYPEHERLRQSYVRAFGHFRPGTVRPGARSLDPIDHYIDERFRNAKRPEDTTA